MYHFMDCFIFISEQKEGHIVKYPLKKLNSLLWQNIKYFQKHPTFLLICTVFSWPLEGARDLNYPVSHIPSQSSRNIKNLFW